MPTYGEIFLAAPIGWIYSPLANINKAKRTQSASFKELIVSG